MSFENLLIERDGAIATVTVNRPKVLNALNTATLTELRAAFTDLQHDAAIRVVIVTGAGEKAFVAGADINELAALTPAAAREQALFGQSPTAPAHDYWGQILDSDGTVLLCLHEWGAHDHPSLMSAEKAPAGNGLLLFFRVDDFEQTLNRARAISPRLDEEPHLNPATGTLEFALRDPDDYYVMVSALS